MTANTSQGGTIREKYNIHEWGRMTFEEQHTALSRCTDIDDVHVSPVNRVPRSEYDYSFVEPETKLLVNASIYNIHCPETDTDYIGRTIELIPEDRLIGHTNDKNCVVSRLMKNPVFKVLFKIVGSKKWIDEFERQTIRYYRQKCGDKLVNIIDFKDIIPRLPKINEMKCILRKDVKVFIVNEGYRLMYNGKREWFKFKKSNTKAYAKLLKRVYELGFEKELIDCDGNLITINKKN